MATRMQQRRGTAAQWISTNSGNGPILNAGEIGYETDTNKFKIGDGTNHWINLDYFIDANSTVNPAFGSSITFEGATANAFETTLAVTDPTADRTITFPDATGTVALTSDIAELSQDAIDAAITAGTGITKTYDDAANTLTLAVNTSTMQARVANVTDTEIGYLDGVTSAIQTQIDAKAPLAAPAFTGNATAVNLTLSGDLTVNGTTTTVNSTEVNIGNAFTFEGATANSFETTLTVADPTADRAINLPDASGTVALQEFVQAAATSTDGLGWNDVTKKITVDTTYIGEVAMDAVAGAISPGTGITKTYDDAANTITLDISSTVATKTYADTAVSTHDSDTTSVHGISNTANLVATTDTGTVTSTMIADGTIVNGDINASAAIDWTKIAPSSTVSATELGYLDGVTSAIQTQINAKQDKVTDVSDTEIGYLNGVTSAIQTQIDSKAPSSTAVTLTGTETLTNKTLTSPVINTPTGITKTDVGLANVDNTTDAGKPVSTATQTALDLKANLSAPTFTGTVTSTNDVVVNGNLTVNGTTFSASSTSITIEDNLVQLAHENAANTVDLGIVVAYNDGTAKHSGIVRDVSDDKWKLFKGVTSEPTTTVNFGQGSLDALAVGALEATTVTPSSGVVFSDGTQTKEGVPSRTPIIQKTDNYTLTDLTERDSLIEVSAASGKTITIPTNATVGFPIGTSIDILQTSTGQVTIAGAGGVTVNATPGLKLRTQWSSATLFKRAENTWVVYGDLTA
jgi:hypothetical protein